MRKTSWLLATGLMTVVAAGAGTWYYVGARPSVETVRPERREVVELVVATGRLKAVRQSGLGVDVAGVVDRVLVEEGDQVEPGQPVLTLRREDWTHRVEQARLAVRTAERELERVRAGAPREDVRRAAAERERAQAALEQALRDLARAQRLWERDLIARADLEQAETAVATARAALAAAEEAMLALAHQPRREDLEVVTARLAEARAALRAAELDVAKRVVAAPFAGLIVHRAVEPGQSVAPGDALLTLTDMRRTELLVETDETNLPRLRTGQTATVIAPAYTAQPFRARLRQIGPEVDANRGVVALRLDPLTLPEYARPDMTVDVNVEVARVPDGLAVPATSVVERGGRSFVVTVRDLRAQLEEVRVLGRNPEWVAVDGLAAETAVVRRAAEVRPGQTVRLHAGSR
jgi:HlyD family secretion protein